MINSAILEVVIGLIFVYWLLALICSTANEIIVGIFGLRSRQLQNGIRRLLEGGQKPKVTPTKDFVDKVLNNHLILGLTNKDQVAIKGPFATGPSYIPARTFATAVFNTLFPVQGGVPSLTEQARTMLAAGTIPAGVREMLSTSAGQAVSKLDDELRRLIADKTIKDDTKKVLGEILTQLFLPVVADELVATEARRLRDETKTDPGAKKVLKVLDEMLKKPDSSIVDEARRNVSRGEKPKGLGI